MPAISGFICLGIIFFGLGVALGYVLFGDK